MKNTQQIFLTLFLVGTLSFIGRIVYGEAKKDAERLRKFKELELEKYESLKAKFKAEKAEFEKQYTDSDIASLTLSSEKFKTLDDRCYLYDKLSLLKKEVINSSISDFQNNNFKDRVTKFKDMRDSLIELDAIALNAKLLYLRKLDANELQLIQNRQKAREEQLKHQREIEIIEEKRKSEVEIYNAKMKVERAKFETMCKALQNSDKNVQSTFNIKASISED